MASYMNPYNFVRLHPMADGTRQRPLGHKRLLQTHNGEPVYNGRLHCSLTAFSPFLVLSHDPTDVIDEEEEHRKFTRFFHYQDDPRPVIPGTSLKGAVRAVAEAASNGCLAVLNEQYVKRWDDFKHAYPSSLRFCGGSDTEGAFCPTCRLFGTAPEEGQGTSERGATPQAFQGKVRFHDAIFQGDPEDIYENPVTLIALLDPKVSNQVWYCNPERGSATHPLAGRKFYYHHDDLAPKTSRNKDKRNRTVRPLKPGAQFTFTVQFRNVLASEFSLLLYALELEPARALVRVHDGEITFDWSEVKAHQGIYPKMGYGKPAGLGSVCVLVTEVTLFDPTARYIGEGAAPQFSCQGNTLREFVEKHKQDFLDAHRAAGSDGDENFRPCLADLRNILRFPNRISHFRYPKISEFKQYGSAVKLPIPGREKAWEG